MTREQKCPDTETFKYFNANPKNRKGGDCVIRAIAVALEQSWKQTVRELTEVGIEKGFVLNDLHTYDTYLQQKGFIKARQPVKANGTKYRGYEFCKELSKGRRIVAHVGTHHVVAIVEDKVHDIWNSTNGIIGNYWYKEESIV